MKPEARPGTLENVNDASVTLRYFAPRGHTLEDCKRPDYWRNVTREAGQQRVPNRHAWNRIEILAEDGTWEAELRILSIDDGLVNTRLLREWPESKKVSATPEPSIPDGYTVEHVAGNGWRALEPGGSTLIEKRTTRDDALTRAIEHAKKAQPKGNR